MNRLYISNQMESLCGKLAGNLKQQPGSIFSKTVVITQGGGMNDWLTRNITETNGVFANYVFQNQDGFLGQVYELLTGEKLRNNRDAIKFGVYSLLDSDQFKEKFKDVASYYKDNDLRRIQLSEKIADLFDQYQLYREKMIKSWNDGKPFSGLGNNKEAEKWQMWLWQQLGIPSKATLRDKIIEILKTDPEKLQQTFPEVHLFGISIYTNFHLEFYKKLSEYIPVHFYLCLPSQEEVYKNTLLESFGTKAKELLKQFDGMETQFVAFQEAAPATLLGRLQQSIVSNKELTEKAADDSIQVTTHFTPVREIETLYNYLLDQFENDKALKPRDVLVITPDINKYEPFIKAVFRNAPVNLPHRVSGAAKNTVDSITASLELIVNMGEDDLTSEKVAGLLEQNRIGKAYRIEDTSYIRGAISKAGIRFGRENSLNDDTHYVSWKYGLEKIILGYAMLTDDAFDVSDRLTEEEKEFLGDTKLTNYPYRDAEASASHDLLRLKALVDDLQNLFDKQKEPRTLAEWKLLLLEEVMEKMVWSNDFSKEDRNERNEIYRALGFTERLTEDVAAEKVPWAVFVNELKKRLFSESREHELNSGAITFTSAIPSRGLPYKVIAFIGLDNGVFPRQDQHLGFDLMGNDYQPGDRSKKEADKSLFLDTIMSAREKLYLSYIGQSVKDNTRIPPSIVLDTLVDYLGLEPTEHPLHGFSNKYRKDDDKLFTYLYNTPPDEKLHETNDQKTSSDPDKNEGPKEEIWAHDFVKFFEAPMDWYFNKVLGIKYDGDRDDTLAETELFDLDHLQQWQIRNKLLKYTGSTEEDLNAFIREHIKKGELPLKNLGRETVETHMEDMEPLRNRYAELTDGKNERSINIDLVVNDIRITGTIDGVWGDEYIHVSTSNSIEKYVVRAYLNSLFLFAERMISSAVLLSPGKKGEQHKEMPLPKTDSDSAMQKLSELMGFLIQGKQRPLIFTLDVAKKLKKAVPITIESVFDTLKQETEDKTINDRPVPGNKYIRRLMDEGYFENLTEENLEEIKTLAGLLNL